MRSTEDKNTETLCITNNEYLDLLHVINHQEYIIDEQRRTLEKYWGSVTAYEEIYNSFSWKLTIPLRRVLDKLKSIMNHTGAFRSFHKRKKIQKETVQVEFDRRRYLDKLLSLSLPEQRAAIFQSPLFFTVILPVYNVSAADLLISLDSIFGQTYPNLELCIADGSDEQHRYISEICANSRQRNRIKYTKVFNITDKLALTETALTTATGDYVCFLNPGDFLHPSALYEIMRRISEKSADLIYTDECVCYEGASEDPEPFVKPDFAPDTLRTANYFSHLLVVKKSLLSQVKKEVLSLGDSSEYDLVLRLSEKAKHIAHISQILYYWHSTITHLNKEENVASSEENSTTVLPSLTTKEKNAISAHLRRSGLVGEVFSTAHPGIYRIRYAITGNPKVSIIILNKDHLADLRLCVLSVLCRSSYQNYEIIIVENGSSDPDLFVYYEELSKNPKIRILKWKDNFNYSAINNFAAQHVTGEYLLLLNNDIEVISPDWIQEMLMYAQREDVGAVGAKLYYPDDTIQHAGVGVGAQLRYAAAHLYRNAGKNEAGYREQLTYVQNLIAVTGACLMINKRKWNQVNGLDESFAIAYNDIDLCMRLRKAGYLVVWTPYAELYHYESRTRGYDDTDEKEHRMSRENAAFNARWERELKPGDPYSNPKFSCDSSEFLQK